MLRTTFVVSSMHGGGTERVLSHMANYWVRRSWPITVLTIFHGAAPPSYALDPRVAHRDLAFRRRPRHPMPDRHTVRALKATFDRSSAPERRLLLRDLDLIATLRRALRATRPDLVISFLDVTNVRVLLAAEGLGIPVIVSERNDPIRNTLSDGMMRLRRRVYPKAAWLVAQTAEMGAFFAAEVGERLRVIPNPVVRPPDTASAGSRAPATDDGRTLVAMGRLVEEKGFDVLLEAFARLASRHASWSLRIWGVGPERARLERLARERGLGGRVSLPGFTHRPFEVLRQADLFVLPSRSEGFPNALCEAMACGRPVVATGCSSAIREIVRDGVDGVIVPAGHAGALAAALDRLMTSAEQRAALGARGVDVIDRFSLDKTMAQWEGIAHAAVRRPVRATDSARMPSHLLSRLGACQSPADAPLGAVE